MHLDEPGDVVHHVGRVPERLEAFASHARAHDLVVVERDAVGRDLTRLGLADVVEQRREPERRIVGSASVFSTTANVWCSTSLCLCTGSCSSCSAASSGRNSCARPVETTSSSPREGADAVSSLVSSSLIRSADTISRRSCICSIARTTRGAGVEFELRGEPRGAEHPQRVVRERDLGVERRVEPLGREVLHAAERIDELALGQPDRHRVDGEVAPGQVGLQVLAERHGRLAVLLRVDLLAERRDLQTSSPLRAPTVPNFTPTRYSRSAHAAQDLRRLLRDGVGREVEIAPGTRPSSSSRTAPPTR